MSGYTDNSDNAAEESIEFKNMFLQINTEGIEEMFKLWNELYGPTRKSGDRFTKLIDDIKAFWECQIECQNERKKNLLKSIEKGGKDALRLENVLGLKAEVQNLTCSKDDPLVVLEEKIWKILSTYQEISDERLEAYNQLKKKEDELCSILGLNPQINNELMTYKKAGNSKRNDTYIPTSDQMDAFKERISTLEKQNEQLQYDFEAYKEKLRLLVEECQVQPDKIFKQCLGTEKADFPITNHNLNLLISTTNHHQKVKEELLAEANHLRNKVASLSKKMFKDTNEIEIFLRQNDGFTKPTIENLKEKLSNLKEERKKNLKDLIISQRKVLNELWEKCWYSEEDKAHFKPYQTKHWSEEVLNFHEIEIENLQTFYEENKRIFQLSNKYDELWERLLHLEVLASNKERLFNNRGGCLLQEEKERKHIQKKVPTIKRELMILLNKYKDATGKDFMHFGMALQEKIKQKEEEREISKENDKLMRKVMNEEKLFLESRLGVRQTIAGTKRRMLTPQHHNNYPKLIKTAQSTPRISRSASIMTSGSVTSQSSWTRVLKENEIKCDSMITSKTRTTSKVARRLQCDTPRPLVNKVVETSQCSLTYETFKENIARPTSKQNNQKCLQPVHNRVLRQRNENKPCSEKKLPRYNTPVANLTIKSATISKIPRPTTPIVPNSATRTRNIRRKFPTIF